MTLAVIAIGACGSEPAERMDLRPRCAPAFQHAYESACRDSAGHTTAPQQCDRPDCTAFCESERLSDPAAWLGSDRVDCYDVQRAWIACNEAVPAGGVPAAGCDCSAEYAAVVACAP